ncbi:MAG: NAD(+) kinase [Legionellales bacterium]|nr:NAD(+) kinase [Legionellales bacterium]
MTPTFSRVTLFARQYRANEGVNETLHILAELLTSLQLTVQLEMETAQFFDLPLPTIELNQLNADHDLVVVVGGDGNLLSAARTAVEAGIAVCGINRGHLGFLTDIAPDEAASKIQQVLEGDYLEESRFLLNTLMMQDEQVVFQGLALNDVVLTLGDEPHMIDFSIYINDKFVCDQRADGIIVATPTGSTAYALSGGGPILHPTLNAVVLVPMFPHKLSSRPIVVEGDSCITLKIHEHNPCAANLSCDGHDKITVAPGKTIKISKHLQQLRLIHPLNYNYYETLRSKLGWERKR